MKQKVILGALVCAFAGAMALLSVSTAAQEDTERQDRKPRFAWKEWQWVDSRSGDCHMSGILTIYSDGYAIWTASTKTDFTHDKDVWHETLEVQDAEGHRLFGFGVWDSPRMDSPPYGGEYNWKRTDHFPAGFFDAAQGATSSGDC